MIAIPWIRLVVIVLVGLLLHRYPRLSRPGLFFSVTVDEGFVATAKGRAVLRRYRVVVWLATAMAIAAVVALADRPAAPIALLCQVVVSTVAWIVAHRRVRTHALPATAVREVSLEARRTTVPGGWLAIAGPCVILAAAAAFLYLGWDAIPDQIPSRFGADGEPLAWRSRTVRGVFGPLLISTVTVTLLLAMAALLASRSRQVAAQGASAVAERRFRSVGVLYLLAVAYLLAAMASWIAIGPLMGSTAVVEIGRGVLAVIVVVLAIAVTIWFVTVGQGGQRLAGSMRARAAGAGDATPDAAWKLGVFYFNPADPALLVEKRMGLGWTLNFGHWLAWLLMAAVPAAILLARLL